ncbi:MAG: hypothetical protein GKC04_06925 [Methanomicrobiales archaeon]|nr:hypothetical protein [Methanomicrobiales archaeon]
MEEETYDMIIPPGTPRTIIAEVIRQYDVEIVQRPQRMYFANMSGDSRELLAFRGKKEEIEKVNAFVLQKLQEFIEED